MCTEDKRFGFLVVAALVLSAAAFRVPAQEIETLDTWEENQALDVAMQVLEPPVWQPVFFPPRTWKGEPFNPSLYRQQPPEAQQDFRPESVPSTPAPVVTAPRPGPRQDNNPSPPSSPVNDEDAPPAIVIPPCVFVNQANLC